MLAAAARLGDDLPMRRADRLFLIIHALRGRTARSRIDALDVTGEVFVESDGRDMNAYLKAMRGYYAGLE
ncbi:MAG: hypothetical protein ACYCZD_06340 [Rhodanobacter sp.]